MQRQAQVVQLVSDNQLYKGNWREMILTKAVAATTVSESVNWALNYRQTDRMHTKFQSNSQNHSVAISLRQLTSIMGRSRKNGINSSCVVGSMKLDFNCQQWEFRDLRLESFRSDLEKTLRLNSSSFVLN